MEVVTLGAVLADADHRGTPLASVAVREATSWSCHHGLARWSAECADARDGRWKQPLRAALDRLAAAIDVVCEREARRLGVDFSAARDSWVDVPSEYAEPDERVERFLADAVNGSPARAARVATDAREHERLEALLSAQASRLAMFASDAWFWEDPSRPETLQALRFAAHAARLLDERADADLERGFVENVRAFRSPLTGQDGSQLYRLALSVVDQAAGVP